MTDIDINKINTGKILKTIKFRRLSHKNIEKYKIFLEIYNDSGELETEELPEIINPSLPDPQIKRVSLEYNLDATWKLPDDAYVDRDHQFRLFIGYKEDGDLTPISSVCIAYDRINKLITLDTVMKEYNINMQAELEYYQDIIIREYELPRNGRIRIQPIFTNEYQYGFHNIII